MLIRTLCSVLLVAAAACYQDKAIGVSGGDKPDPPAPAKPKLPTQIQGQPNEIVHFRSPNAGDMDGDGFDDFVLAGQRLMASGEADREHQSLYLFYGKAEFPAQISTADADAVFEVDDESSGPVGDLNGDGLGDLMLVRLHSVEFAFGSTKRFHGGLAPESAGPVWRAGEFPPPFAPGFVAPFVVARGGDVNGDGCEDLIVSAMTLSAPAEDGTGGGLISREYLVHGHTGEWKSATWDSTWASSGFGFDAADGAALEVSEFTPSRAGDLDGDGRDDLLAATAEGSLLFYGKPEHPSAILSQETDAFLLSPAHTSGNSGGWGGGPWFIGAGFGDLDGDGQSDLALVDEFSGAVRFAYGRRWSGESRIKPEFEVTFEASDINILAGAATGDIDGDSFPELLLSVSSYVDSPDPVTELQGPQTAIYVIRGTGERQVGARQLTRDDLWDAPGHAPSLQVGAEGMLGVSLGGDVDGDGGQDILTNRVDTDGSGQSVASVYLVPSTPRSPD